jgi:predicted regulator of Ras-like GTPase activity (Roadblock/LC7/MglB family)
MGYSLRDHKTVKPPSLKRILHEMNQAGNFEISVLTSTEGLPIATAPTGYDSAHTAATVALLQRASNDTQRQLGATDVDEVMICDHDHARLVCRYLPVGERRLILAVKVPPGCSYRRITNQALRRIRRLLS